jgi:hypothetical protein
MYRCGEGRSDGEMEMGKSGDKEIGRNGDGEMGRWGVESREKYLSSS